ncbi:hypothetical protein [Cellulomonas sp.]|uniref:hypothetical protein n=1 Tax=Cellulomonas sp. TaxID=40001 RepID=UPI003BA90312
MARAAVMGAADGAPSGTDEPPAESAETRGAVVPTTSRVVWQEIVTALTSAALGGLSAVWALRLWAAHLNVPLVGSGDALLNLMLVRNMQLTGWFQSTPLLGAPIGQDLRPWPVAVGDLWSLLSLKALSLVLSPAASVNVFFVLGFPLVAAVACLCFRGLSISRPISIVLGAAYAILPYHFQRSEPHLFLSAYYAAPIGCLVAMWIYTRQVDLWRSPRLYRWREYVVLASAVVLIGGGMYYAAFGLVLAVVAALLRAIGERTVRPLATAAAFFVIVVGGIGLAALPNLLYLGSADADSAAVTGRSYAASEFFGLKIVNLVLPAWYHRIPALADLRAVTGESVIPGENTETLGVLGLVGFVAVLLAVLVPVAAHRPLWRRQLHPLGVLTVVALLFSTVAGLNSVAAALAFDQLRAWNRMSVNIAFLSLAGLAVLIDRGLHRLGRRWPVARRPLARAGVAAVVLGIALFDQTGPAIRPDYPHTSNAWNADADYFQQLEDRYGAGAAVFQIPYSDFPEAPPVVSMAPYDHLRAYVHSDLAWSYGAVKGAFTSWQEVALSEGIPSTLPKLVSAGFQAIYVNRNGYADHGVAEEAAIVATIGPQVPFVNPDNTLAVYDLRPYASRLRAEGAQIPSLDQVLHPVRIEYGTGFFDPEADATKTWRWGGAQADAVILNPTDDPVHVMLTGSIVIADPRADVTVTVGDDEHELRVVNHVATLAIPVVAPPGTTPLAFVTDSAPTTAPGETRDLRQQIIDLHLSPLD